MPARSATSSWVSRRRSRAFPQSVAEVAQFPPNRRRCCDLCGHYGNFGFLLPNSCNMDFPKNCDTPPVSAAAPHIPSSRACDELSLPPGIGRHSGFVGRPAMSSRSGCRRLLDRSPQDAGSFRNCSPNRACFASADGSRKRSRQDGGRTAASQGGLRNAGGLCGTAEACWVSECV